MTAVLVCDQPECDCLWRSCCRPLSTESSLCSLLTPLMPLLWTNRAVSSVMDVGSNATTVFSRLNISARLRVLDTAFSVWPLCGQYLHLVHSPVLSAHYNKSFFSSLFSFRNEWPFHSHSYLKHWLIAQHTQMYITYIGIIFWRGLHPIWK